MSFYKHLFVSFSVIEVDIRGRSCLDIAKIEAHGDIADILVEYKKMGWVVFFLFSFSKYLFQNSVM